MPANLSGPTLIVILFIVLLLFGAPKLPALAKSLGQSMKILKKEVGSSERDAENSTTEATEQQKPPASPEDAIAQAKAEAAAAKAEADAARAETESLRAQGTTPTSMSGQEAVEETQRPSN